MKIQQRGKPTTEHPPDDRAWIGKTLSCNKCGTRFTLEDGDIHHWQYETVRGFDEGYAPIRANVIAYCPTCGEYFEVKGKKYRLENGEWKRVRF